MSKDKARRGVFRLSEDIIEDEDWHVLEYIFSKFVIIRCEHLYANREFEYYAFSQLFEPMSEGYISPEYNVILTKDDDGNITLECKKALPDE